MKKGFTLIELLAVIVILAIIALIATPIILGIINDAREESNERSIELYASAVRNAIAAYQLKETNAPKSFSDLTVEYEGSVECTKEELYEDGSFYLEGCKVNGSEKTYSYGTQQGSTVAKVCSIEQKDASKYSVGDVVTCNIGDEPDKFYVIADAELSASTIQMLTEKNIHTTEHRQSSSAGTVEFSASNYDGYWSSTVSSYPADVYDERNDVIKPIVDGYVSYLNESLIEDATGSLLTYSQATSLGCDGSVGNCTADYINGGPAANPAPTWVYSTSYWTGSASNSAYVWYVDSRGGFTTNSFFYGRYDGDDGYGVRSVITISTSEI